MSGRVRPNPRQPPARGAPPRSNTMSNLALGAGALFVLPSLFSGLFGGGGGGGGYGGGGGVGDIIQLLPLMMIGGGALYAYSVFKK